MVSYIAIILEGGYLYLIKSLRAWKIYGISLSMNRSGSCCAVVVLRRSEKPLRRMKLLTHVACHKKRFLTLITFTFIKIFLFDHDEFP